LLAVAEYIEETALRVANEERPTTAARLMQKFADRPFSTWRNLEPALQPYMQRLMKNKRAGFLINRQKELDQIMALFESDKFLDDSPLDGEFLLGYHCQRQFWKENKTENENITSEENNESGK
jgi:CRISPR-associated protein Csd1